MENQSVAEKVESVTDDQIISDKLDIERMIAELIDKKLDKKFDSIVTLALDKTPDKPKPVEPIKRTYTSSWSSYRKDDGYLQPSGSTKEERYPKIYDSAVTLHPKAKRILSFGCSTGEELFALAKRFTEAKQFVGVDIDHYRIQTARKNNKQDNIFFHDTLGALGQFDVVTALNVFFCLEKPTPRDQWEKTLKEVAAAVAPGGVLMIFKSEYDPMVVLEGFKVENEWNHTHNRNNKDYFCGYYRRSRKKLGLW